MEHPKTVGERSQLAIAVALDRVGYPVLLPLGENTRYDLVIDEGTRLARVQCKTGRLRGGAVRFKACSSYAHHPNPKILKRDYVDEIEYFGVYCAETDGVYLIPIEEVQPRWECALRVHPARNGQQDRIRKAADYEIAQVRIEATAGPGGRPGAGGSCA
jgi:PD-(D/E)XK endonuclease